MFNRISENTNILLNHKDKDYKVIIDEYNTTIYVKKHDHEKNPFWSFILLLGFTKDARQLAEKGWNNYYTANIDLEAHEVLMKVIKGSH